MAGQDWEIQIDRFDGFCPGFWKNSAATYGNKEHATAMRDIDLTDPNVLTQGPGLTVCVGGDEDGYVDTLIRGIERVPGNGSRLYLVGGNKAYYMDANQTPQISASHTITGGGGTVSCEDVITYKSALYYSYYESGVSNIGRTTNNFTSQDDDYMSTVPTGATNLTGSGPFQMVVGADDKLYITNGPYIASFDGTTFTDQALDFPTSTVTQSIAWANNRLYVATMNPNLNYDDLSQSNASIYIWDTTSTSWEYQIQFYGIISALYVRHGVVYVWYRDQAASGGLKLGYIDGYQIKELATFTGKLPAWYQVTDYENHLMWISKGDSPEYGQIWAYGSVSDNIPPKLFIYADAGLDATYGGISNANGGTVMVASNGGTDYQIAYLTGYSTNSTWNSMVFDVSSGQQTSYIDTVTVLTEAPGDGAVCDMTIKHGYGNASDTHSTMNQIGSGTGNAASTDIGTSGSLSTRTFVVRHGRNVDNFRLDFDWSNGSATNPLKIRKIIINGRFVTNK